MLADLWKRALSASLIAEMIGTTPGAVLERARRAGLPGRYGVALIETNEKHDPLDYPICQAISAQMIPKLDKETGKPWFVKPRDVRRWHASEDTRKRIARHA